MSRFRGEGLKQPNPRGIFAWRTVKRKYYLGWETEAREGGKQGAREENKKKNHMKMAAGAQTQDSKNW